MFRHAFTHVSTVILLALSSTVGHAATMARVVDAPSGNCLTLDSSGSRMTVTLAGVEPLGAPMAAQVFLQRSVVGAWVMVERDGNGTVYVYRSPDGSLLNTLMIRDGYARVSDAPFEHRADFERVESDARANWRGAWRNLQTEGAARDSAVYLGELNPAKGGGGEKRASAKSTAPKTRSSHATRRRR